VSTRDFSWGTGGRCVWLTNYHPCSAETSRKSGTLIYPEPFGPPRPVAGDLYFTYFYFNILVTTLKMAKLVAERCRWLLCKRITFIHSSEFVGLLKIIHLINARDMESITLIKKNFAEIRICLASEC